MEQEVIVGKAYMGRWVVTNIQSQNPRRMSLTEACEDMAKYWNCTPENARESLLKHGFASSPLRDWRLVGRGFDEGETW